MQFINAHRPAQRGSVGAGSHPVMIVPVKPARVPDNGGIIRCGFKKEANRVGFFAHRATGSKQVKYIMHPLPDIWDEQLPHARVAEATHGMGITAPMVEVALDTHATGVGCPHRKANAMNTVDLLRMCAKLVVDAALVTLTERVQVPFTYGRREGIGITRAPLFAIRPLDIQFIRAKSICPGALPFKDIRLSQATQRNGGAGVIKRHSHDSASLGQQRTHHHVAINQVHAQQVMRRRVPVFNQRGKTGF